MSGGTRKEGDTVGDYRLVRAVSVGEMTRTWEGEQLSMQRPVMLEMLRVQAMQEPALVQSFLSDVRAKALVTHPGVGAVYEAVSNEEATFFARERLDGENFEVLRQAGGGLAPVEIMVYLGQIAEAMLYLENEGVATTGYELQHFILTGKEHARIMNLAVEGARDPQADTKTKEILGNAFHVMIKSGLPGATRVKSLCGFMSDTNRPVPLTWKQIADLCRQVREQLQESGRVKSPILAEPAYQVRVPAKIPASVWALVGGVALIGGLILLMVFSKGDKKPDPDPVVDTPEAQIEIPSGRYTISGGKRVVIREAFSMSRTEVTLAQYNAFLEFPDHAKFEHPNQPASKKDHFPDDWKTLWPAAVKRENWQGRPMSLECPVVGIDWWDAYAFAKWSQGRLPTMAEWAVAAEYEGGPQKPSPWGPVGRNESDVTGAGLTGMAGSVREWISQPEVNPADPLGPKGFLVSGSSFQEAGKGIATRLWVDSQDVRRNDLGFRIIAKK